MPKTITTTVYSYDELNDEAKKTALNEVRTNYTDPEQAELGEFVSLIEDEIGDIVHIGEINDHGRPIYFLRLRDNAAGSYQSYTDRYPTLEPNVHEIDSKYNKYNICLDIALQSDIVNVWNEGVASIQKRCDQANAKMEELYSPSGENAHEMEREINNAIDECDDIAYETKDCVASCINKLVDTMYDWWNSEEWAKQAISANEFEFLENGELYSDAS